MTHDELIRAVSRKTGFTQAVVREIIHAMRDTWICYLEATGHSVSLYRFGVFKVAERKSRVVISPFLGTTKAGKPKAAEIPAYKVLQFRPSIHVKRTLNVKNQENDPKKRRKKPKMKKKK